MKSKQYLGILGLILLLIGGFIPIAKLNEEVISIFPVWNNIELQNGLWQWRDISFFAVTIVLIIFLTIYLLIVKKYLGFIVTGVLSLFIILIIFIALLQVNSKVSGVEGVSFSFSWGLVVAVASGIAFLLAGLTKQKLK
ncbi:MAG: hypothetical protein NTX22_05575 [Ignavibacteriales bacterium]|nr:hypothetical protein [Ignavibacteriales bacterium]